MRKVQLFSRMFGQIALGALVSGILTGGLGAQSLGEIARRVRAEKEMAPKAKRVFTNDSLPRQTTINAVGAALAAPAAGDKGKPGDARDGQDKGASGEDEKTWRGKFAKLREALAYEEKRLDVSQRELNLAQMQNYSDPNVALREQFQRTEVNKRTQEIDQIKAAVDKAKQAIADAEDELHKKGLPSGWSQG